MNRRTFVGTTALAAMAQTNPQSKARPAVYELRYFRLRNTQDAQMQRTSEFLAKSVVPAARRAGVGTMGFFAPVIAPDTPFILALFSHASMAEMETSRAKLNVDPQYVKDADAFSVKPGLGYMRMESSLLRAFDSMPQIEIPATDDKRPARIFELRTYESNNMSTLRRKIKMFEEGEIDIFRKTGLQPVFFASTVIGPKMPNLTYMLAFDNLAAREKNWSTFVSSPEWKKLSARPEYADADIVSNISGSILRPLAFSDIK